MQKRYFYKTVLLFVFFALIVMQGSSEDYYHEYDAVYMDRANLEKSVFYMETGKEMKNPGKIYYKHPYLFINEKYKGVHIIDNTNPVNPEKKGFIVAPGCLDMAVKDSIIYLDNSVDLVAFDLKTKQEVKRIREALPAPAPPGGFLWYNYSCPENFIIVEWVKR